jgi:WD40 repeat protein
VIAAAFSPDGQFIVTASDDKTARIWEARTGQERQHLTGHSGAVGDAAYSPDGTQIVTASADGTVRIWDSGTSKELRSFRVHAGRARSAAFSPDGKTIVTAGCDLLDENDRCRVGSARVWDAASGRELRALTGHAGEVLSAAHSPDGEMIPTAGADWTARIWDASIEDLLNAARRLIQRDPPQLTSEEWQRLGLD